MAASMLDLKAWFEAGEIQGSTHMIIVCDTYDYDDYPVYVSEGNDPREIAASYDGKEMQKVMECYKISLGWDSQSKEHRAYNWDM